MSGKEKINKSKANPQSSGASNTIRPSFSKKISRGTLHPHYRTIEVLRTDGSSFKVCSTYKNSVLRLDIDPKTHPAWTKETGYINTRSSEITKFNNKFAGLSFKLK